MIDVDQGCLVKNAGTVPIRGIELCVGTRPSIQVHKIPPTKSRNEIRAGTALESDSTYGTGCSQSCPAPRSSLSLGKFYVYSAG